MLPAQMICRDHSRNARADNRDSHCV
jgi:hypothetical protein